MFRPVALFIGLRYVRAKQHQHFISFISLISMLGIAIGITVLITVLSVLNGFDREIKKQIFGMIPPITVSSYQGKIENWQELEKNMQLVSDITATSPFISNQAMLTNSTITEPSLLIGILPVKEKGTSTLPDKIILGNLANLTTGHSGIVLGKELADQLHVTIGDNITVITVKDTASTSITPHFSKFHVVGIFKAGGGNLGFDSKMAFINLYDAQKLFAMHSAITGLHINVRNIYYAPNIADKLQNQLLPTFQIWNWTEQLGDFFENIRLTKTIMFFLFVLIITVAVFNLICTMVMMVKNKQADIAILRTLGATPIHILTIFIVQGVTIGIGGTLLGITGGVLLAWKIPLASAFIQHLFHVQLISANVYFVDYLPSELQWSDVFIVSLIALALSLLATLYPAWHASKIQPAKALQE